MLAFKVKLGYKFSTIQLSPSIEIQKFKLKFKSVSLIVLTNVNYIPILHTLHIFKHYARETSLKHSKRNLKQSSECS